MSAIRSMVLVSSDPLSIEKGATYVYERLQEEIKRVGLTEEVSLHRVVSDIGQHDIAPTVIIYPESVIYGPIYPENVPHLVEEHLSKGQIVTELLAPLTGHISWLSARKGALPVEQRIVLQRAGFIDPEDIEDYILQDGYVALYKVIKEMTPCDVIEELNLSGLQGRGGAGFPTGMKWNFVSKTPGSPKYIICNADESEPGTFKDRVILEGDPHNIIEAMTIAAYAVNASIGFIYIRGEYQLAQKRMHKAIQQAQEYGFLGNNIFGSDFSFEIHVHSGAGAYICGEETALIESIEGKRGEPRSRPPYPTTHGLWGKPTVVNNVETLANIPPIIRNGWSWYRQFGTPSSPGTKVYMILGNVNNPGLIEVPMGITLREIISIYGGGMKNGARFKLAQTGGSSGSIIPASLQDTPMDFASFKKTGVSLGSGALLICDESVCVVDLARVLLNFFRTESCGKCTPCRVGTLRAYNILTRMSEGGGSMQNIAELESLSENLVQLANCGLGNTAGTGLTGVLTHFRAEVEAHIKLQVCPTGVCVMS